MTDSDKNRAVPVSVVELDALRRDAKRYRWLRKNRRRDALSSLMAPCVILNPPDLDDAIDSAMDGK